jgi:hypothetical protein
VALGFALIHGNFSYSRRTASSMSASASWFQCIEPQRSHRPIGTSARQWMLPDGPLPERELLLARDDAAFLAEITLRASSGRTLSPPTIARHHPSDCTLAQAFRRLCARIHTSCPTTAGFHLGWVGGFCVWNHQPMAIMFHVPPIQNDSGPPQGLPAMSGAR